MTYEEFGQYVNEGIEAIPKKFLDKLDNVAITIEEFPTPLQLRKQGLPRGWTLFGLYEGIPLTRRGSGYAGVLPDKITIFRGPIMQAASTPEQVKEIVKNTVWHEIAHHFGMDETHVQKSERKRGTRK